MQMVRYKTEDGVTNAILVATGRKYSQVIMMDSTGIRIRRVPKTEEKYMVPTDYPLEEAKRRFRDAVLRFNYGHVSNGLEEALRAES